MKRVTFLFLIFCATVSAQTRKVYASYRPELVFGAGSAGIFDDEFVPLLSVEYRFAQSFHGIRPLVSVSWATDGAVYLGAAASYGFELGKGWMLTGAIGPGYYERNHSSKDLGSSFEVLSTLELTVPVGGKRKVGLSVGHISNGSMSNNNPGSEILRLVYVIPL